jgi:hypothetical protein
VERDVLGKLGQMVFERIPRGRGEGRVGLPCVQRPRAIAMEREGGKEGAAATLPCSYLGAGARPMGADSPHEKPAFGEPHLPFEVRAPLEAQTHLPRGQGTDELPQGAEARAGGLERSTTRKFVLEHVPFDPDMGDSTQAAPREARQ